VTVASNSFSKLLDNIIGSDMVEPIDWQSVIANEMSARMARKIDHEVLFGINKRKARDPFEEAVKRAKRKYEKQK
jgi:hypothetical protein